MSTTVAPGFVEKHARALRHFVSTRGVEVCVLQASPLLGAYLGGVGFEGEDGRRLALLMLGSIALTAHAFVLNDWVGYASDARDLRRSTVGADGYGIGRNQIGRVAVVLLLLAAVAFAAVGRSALLLCAAIATLSVLYSVSPRLGKGMPVAASIHHLVGGALHFLLGYTMVEAVDSTGAVLSLFFGLVFAAGHLNQEVRDYELDRASGVLTSAVAFGCRRGFLASFSLFTTAYGLLVGLSAAGVLPTVLLLSAVAWLVQARWSLQALRRGLGFETALWMQRRYRVLFALIGLAMLAS